MRDTFRKILVAGDINRLEEQDLIAAAQRLALPLEVVDVTHMPHEYDAYQDVGVLFWRSGAITRQFPKQNGRATFLSEMDRHTPIVNRTTLRAPHYTNKSVQQARFKKYAHRISAIKSIDTYLAQDTAALHTLIDEGRLVYPFIAKPNHGGQGKGIELIETSNDIPKIAEHVASMVFQNFIPNEGDYRVFIIGGVPHDIMVRRATEASSKIFLNNVSQGGIAERVTDQKKRDQLAKASCVIASMFDYTICGVDILEDLDGNFYFLEVNSVPQWQGLQRVASQSVSEHIIVTLNAIAHAREQITASAVRDYYLQKLVFLPPHLQFHFLSRLHLWSRKRAYISEITAARATWWNPEVVIAELEQMYSGNHKEPQKYRGRAYRAEATARHPYVGVYNNLFFKCIFDETIFDGKGSAMLREHIDMEHLAETRRQLLEDPASLFVLSTVAVNFLYHCGHFFGNEGLTIDPAFIMEVGKTQRVEGVADLDARIYFYTHAIIGASHFYAQSISGHARVQYQEMIKGIERILAHQYVDASLDHKTEFLVCCRLVGYDSYLEPVIRSELERSVSPHGLYFVNRHNTHAHNPAKQSMLHMEHTNVLALMALLGPDEV